METTELDMSDVLPRMQVTTGNGSEKLEARLHAEARSMLLPERRVVLDDVETITAYCR